MLYFDIDQLEKVFFNLLTNAFKFTPVDGRVFLIVEPENEKIKIKVNDTGQSIAPEHLKNLFNNFFQVADYGTQNTGYGIGLALSKNIIELHKGTITVESAAVTPIKNGENSFTVTLLKGDRHFEKSNHTIEANPAESLVKEDLVRSMLIPQELSNGINKAENKEAQFTIMTVEDNDELRALIRDTLQGEYHVLECANGVQGLALATEQIPDLIISDVLMPEMDGLTFCHHLKTDERTSHIPVILLTAKSSQADQISGLETGADVYLVKPFSTRALELNVRNLLSSRERMRERFKQQLVSLPQEETITTEEEYGLSNVDNSFIEKIMKLIDDHMYDPDFSAGSLSVKAGMNQAVLFKKIKAITDLSLNDFIKSHRLKKAAQLLLQGDSRIADIAFMVGYHDRRYFSREFKKQFGKLPKEYGNRTEEEGE